MFLLRGGLFSLLAHCSCQAMSAMPASIPPIVSLRVGAAAEVRGHELQMHFLLLLLLRFCEEHGWAGWCKKRGGGKKTREKKTRGKKVLNALSASHASSLAAASPAFLSLLPLARACASARPCSRITRVPAPCSKRTGGGCDRRGEEERGRGHVKR